MIYYTINLIELRFDTLIKRCNHFESEINKKDKIIEFLIKEKRKLTIKYVRVSAYSLSKDECDDDETIGALNQKIIPGYHAAVSRDLIYLLNKKIYLESIGVFVIKDVMSKRFINAIDICLNNKKMCRNFGIRENIKMVLINE